MTLNLFNCQIVSVPIIHLRGSVQVLPKKISHNDGSAVSHCKSLDLKLSVSQSVTRRKDGSCERFHATSWVLKSSPASMSPRGCEAGKPSSAASVDQSQLKDHHNSQLLSIF